MAEYLTVFECYGNIFCSALIDGFCVLFFNRGKLSLFKNGNYVVKLSLVHDMEHNIWAQGKSKHDIVVFKHLRH